MSLKCFIHFADCLRESLSNSLVIVGEIGRNDYNYAFRRGKTFEEDRNIVPEMVEIVENAVRVSCL